MRSRPLLHLGLFLATCASTCFAYFWQLSPERPFAERLHESVLFAACVVLILGAHEMGHYLMARRHGVDASLPYFIPVPFGFGTLGAVIRIRARIPTRDALVDIGAAGPLAGLAFALPLLVIGTVLSKVVASAPAPAVLLGPWSLSSVLGGLYQWLQGHHTPAAPQAMYLGDNLLTLGVARLVKGPLAPGMDLDAHPVFMAAWFGLLVTMFNLFPIGQLDGGHLTHAWFGPRAITLGKALTFFMALLMALCSIGWLPWLLVTGLVIGYRHPDVSEPVVPLSRGRKVVCAVCFVFFALTLMPVPISTG
jgi:membrane-associated protease RseP (regulator of RpoE activity)